MKRDTTQWVRTDVLVPHPDNVNKMSEKMLAKLRRNIEDSGTENAVLMPPIIVRSLEKSVAFTEEHAAGKLQIIDGEHRWLVRRAMNLEMCEVSVWPGVTDERAIQYLLTLNYIHGDPITKKRRQLLQSLVSFTSDAEGLAEILPDSLEDIIRSAEKAGSEAAGKASESAKRVTRIEPLTVFVQPDQGEVIRRAIETKLVELDPEHQNVECREGTALAAICRAFLGVGV